MKYYIKHILSAIIFYGISVTALGQQKPERVIVFLVDGLHWKAPSKLKMPNFNKLVAQGTYIQKSYMITPHHPTVGDYGSMHTSSFPNPVLQAGTLFVSSENKYLQESFSPKHQTAFIGNSTAYTSVSRGFTTVQLDPSLSDQRVTERVIEVLKNQDVKYLRVHLQTPGNEGRFLSYTTPDKPYFRNIWGEGSPYVKYIQEADGHLGNLIKYLKDSKKWDSTLLIVGSDQGQAEIGWHPMIDRDSWIVPLVFTGPGIAKKRELPYFEHTDLAPTIAKAMGVEVPNANSGGAGKFIPEILASNDASKFKHPQHILKINEQINEFNSLRSKIMLAAEKDPYFSSLITFLENELLTPEPFYHQDRFTEWHKAGTTEHLIAVNQAILRQMRQELKGTSKTYNVPK